MPLSNARASWLLVALAGILAIPADAADPPEVGVPGPSVRERPSLRPDFLFGTPKASFAIRGGWRSQLAGSEIYDFMSELLTIEKGDFGGPSLAIDITYRLRPRLDALFRFQRSEVSLESEFRDFVEQNDAPITQHTELTRTPLVVGVKYYLTPRGREISRLAWVPPSLTVYVGGAGGWAQYEFRHYGDFVDFEDLSIFYDNFSANGWTPTFQLFAGTEVKLLTRLFLTAEASYAWARSDMGPDFVGFDPMDLSGLETAVGFQVVF